MLDMLLRSWPPPARLSRYASKLSYLHTSSARVTRVCVLPRSRTGTRLFSSDKTGAVARKVDVTLSNETKNTTATSASAVKQITSADNQDEQEKNAKFSFAGLKRLWPFVRPAQRELTFGILCLPPALASSMALPFFVGKVVDGLTAAGANADIHSLQPTIAILLAASTVGSIATVGRSYYIHLSGEIVTRHIRTTLFGSAVNKQVSFFDANKTGDLMSRLSADTSIISSALTESTSMLLRGVGSFALGAGFLFYTSWELATVCCLTLVPFAVMSRVYGSWLRVQTKLQLERFGAATAAAEEAFSNIRTVVSFQREPFEAQRYGSAVQKTFEVGKTITTGRAVYMGTANMIINVAMISVLGYGATMVAHGTLTPGNLTSFLLYAVQLGGSLFQLSAVYSSVMRCLAAADRVFEVTEDTQSDTTAIEAADPVTIPSDAMKGSLVFDSVNFSYPSRPSVQVLKDFNLVVPAGSVVAVVGGSGCGKSTLISLLTRFYEPSSGVVTVDGVCLAQLDLGWLRAQIGTVSQDANLFSCSVADNIRYGKLDATEEEVREAAEQANAHGFISAFPDKYSTLVGERGASLSGGQRQRLAIARAILKDPRVLLLDEATSALDVESEGLVQQALERLMLGRTVVVITHRLSTIKNADYIAFMDNGKVVEFGKRAEVLALKDGRFNQHLAQSYEKWES